MKESQDQRIKNLEEKVKDLQLNLLQFMAFVGYEGKPYESGFEKNTNQTITINFSK